MNIGFIGTHQYKAFFENMDFVKVVDEISIDDTKKSYDGIVVVEDNQVSAPFLTNVREQFSNAKMLVIKMDDLSNLNAVCKAHGISIVKDGLDETSFLKYVKEAWFSINSSEYENVIAVFGTHSQTGATQLAYSIAHELFTSNHTVCLVGLNLYNPGVFPKRVGEFSLDGIYKMLELNQVEKIKPSLIDISGVAYLTGNKNPLKVQEFEIEPLSRLIDYLKEEYDYVVLDAGSRFDNAGSLAALMFSNIKMIVGTQQDISISAYKNWQFHVLNKLNIPSEQFIMVVNKYSAAATLSPTDLSESTGLNYISHIPFVIGAEDKELEHGILKGQNKDYDKSVSVIVKGILTLNDDVLQEASGKKKKRFGIF